MMSVFMMPGFRPYTFTLVWYLASWHMEAGVNNARNNENGHDSTMCHLVHEGVVGDDGVHVGGPRGERRGRLPVEVRDLKEDAEMRQSAVLPLCALEGGRDKHVPRKTK
jgi:hypothetical protein